MGDDRILNHKIQIFLSVVSFGFWLPIYALLFIFLKSSSSTIEKRRMTRETTKDTASETARERRRRLIKNTRAQNLSEPQNLGYKKGSFLRGGKNYSLACSHQIRAQRDVSFTFTRIMGKTVWCEVCKESRTVTGSSWTQE